MENIPLMEVNGDESLKLPPLNLGEILCCDVDQHVKHLQEHIVGVVHDLLVASAVVEGDFSVSRPDKLDTQNANLRVRRKGERRIILSFCLVFSKASNCVS